MHPIKRKTYLISDEGQMLNFGKAFAKNCLEHQAKGAVIFLHGDLGAGKTTFSRGFIRGLGHQGAVKSPTYTLIEPYELTGVFVYHFDFYRVGDPQECEEMGLRDYLDDKAYCLIEWPEKVAGFLPEPFCHIHIETQKTGRRVHVDVQGEAPAWLETLEISP